MRKRSAIQLSLDPEREKAVTQIAAFSILTHARLSHDPRQTVKAENRLRALGVDVRFREQTAAARDDCSQRGESRHD